MGLMMTRGASSHVTWADLLAEATTPGQVIGVVRDFMATWTPPELSALPPSCQPPKFGTAEDVVLYTFALVEHEMRQGQPDPGVFRMSSFFSQATRRVTQLMGELQQQSANASRVED